MNSNSNLISFIAVSAVAIAVLATGCYFKNTPVSEDRISTAVDIGINIDETKTDETTGPIGYIGCSNTRETVEGYYKAGGTRLWKPESEYDGGAVVNWVEGVEKGNKFWTAFDKHLTEDPGTKVIWWQLCVRDKEDTQYKEAQLVVERIKKNIPDAVIYVSPLPDYTEGTCGLTGEGGIKRAEELAHELVYNNNLLAGPVLGPMTPENTASDGCHLSAAGKQKLGEQLKEFFKEPVKGKETGEKPSEEILEQETPVEEKESFEQKAWGKRIDAVFAPSDCAQGQGRKYGELYYSGPLIDTHYHIPSLPDSTPREDEPNEPLGMRPMLGINLKITDIVCTLEQDNTTKIFAFFPSYPEIYEHQIEVARRTMENYPDKFVPFIMPPDHDNDKNGFPTVNSELLQQMLAVQPSLFQGYGEIGLYARENGSPELPPDSPRLLEIYPVLRENKLVAYFHLGRDHKDNIEKAAQENPDIKFIFHGDQLSITEVEDVIAKHPNVYYTIDELYGDVFLIRPEVSKEEFLQHFENYEELLEKDLSNWKSVIERHPNQFMWGTDRSDQILWSHDPDSGIALSNYARAFIARLDPSVQEKFAYKNAEELIK